jgi:DNA-binding SARP family transcriptional activator
MPLEVRAEKILQVRMLGKFQVIGLNGELGVNTGCSKTLIKLMAYIFSHRKEHISSSRIAAVLYEDTEIADPVSDARNLIWRLRKLFKKVWGEVGCTFLMTDGSDYYWNPDICLVIDAEQMEALSREAEQVVSEKEKIEKYSQAAALYQGNYMEGYDDLQWVAYLSVYYQTCYLRVVKKLAELLEKNKRYEEVQKLMDESLRWEPLDEELYVCFIRSLIRLGYTELALQEYKKAEAFLYENLGHSSSLNHLHQLYEDEFMGRMHGGEKNIHEIQMELQGDLTSGPFFCEYVVFKQIYRLESQKRMRLGLTARQSLILVGIRVEDAESEEQERKLLGRGMLKLEDALQKSLRSGDIITRYSDRQFLFMLSSCGDKNAAEVQKRLEKEFRRQSRKKNVRLEYSQAEM